MWKSLALIGSVLLSAQAFADDSVYIESLNFNGSGCSLLDTSAVLYPADGLPQQFQVLFGTLYIAQQGSGLPAAERRKNCIISVALHLPQGFQFSIAQVQYSGYAQLPLGTQGVQQSAYVFPLFSNPVSFRTTLNGQYQGNYTREDVLGLASVVWSPCGTSAPLTVRTQVFLAGNPNPPAFMTLDEIDGYVKEIYYLQWRQCTSDYNENYKEPDLFE